MTKLIWICLLSFAAVGAVHSAESTALVITADRDDGVYAVGEKVR